MVRAKVDEIKRLMVARGWRVEDLAHATGLSHSMIRTILRNEPVGQKSVIAFCNVFGVPFETIFEVDIPNMVISAPKTAA